VCLVGFWPKCVEGRWRRTHRLLGTQLSVLRVIVGAR
jgi:hypothetical protein